ncbi:hypothetical protein M408DRAFT_29398 [Serendipita vermifera MAFF 305830]|uniref:Uncharacterized protein n=1 Tax=Serendipita vermifera MAFF 305830 TaxID=933852 RepID=A0A0C3ANQ1_SERVB|nr:hypothetical protein M408DRAFT_29398 [Serendipita vermifera MAFF 305830]
MLVLILAYSFMQGVYTEAGPIPASLDPRKSATLNGNYGQRNIWSIIWSCLSTIFLCTWVSIHPNIHFVREKPGQNWFRTWLWDPLWEVITYKLPLFLWALLVPEYILAWAVRQFLQAGVIKKKVPGWTR